MLAAASRHARAMPLRAMRVPLAAALSLLVVSAPAREALAQSARASFFIQMLTTNADARVRVSAALRLGPLREAAAVPRMIQAYGNERDASVQAAILSSFGDIGDPAALPTVQAATRSSVPAVAAQARRALTILQPRARRARSGPGPTAPSGGSRRWLIAVGSVNMTGSRNPQLVDAATQSLQRALSGNGSVVFHTGPAATAQNVMRSQNLRGHYFNANIQSVTPNATGVRVAVSIAVQSYPGRVYEFESSSALSISGGSGSSPQTQSDAVSRAIESAVNRAIGQLNTTP